MFGNECERPLLQPKLGAFLDTKLGAFGRTAKCREHRSIRAEANRIIAPVSGRDHSAIKVEYPHHLAAV